MIVLDLESETRASGLSPCCAIAECSKASSSRRILSNNIACSRTSLPPMLRVPSVHQQSTLRPPLCSTEGRDGSSRTCLSAARRDNEDVMRRRRCRSTSVAQNSTRTLLPRRSRRWPPSSEGGLRMPSAIPTIFFCLLVLVSTASFTAAKSVALEEYSLGPSSRDLSKRATPADISDFTRALAKRQSSTQGLATENQVMLTMSQPATCRPLNITWDPTKGTPPFTLYVAAELWFPLSIVNIPATYADTSLKQWLFTVDLPSFKNPPPGSLSNPAIFASIVDSTGKMANTSAFLTVDNTDQSCDKQAGTVEFDSWTDGGPIQCTPWALGWNVTHTEFKGPMKPMIFPEKQPPLALTPPTNLSAESDGTGGMHWTVTVPAGTYILYSITDEGSPGTGGGVGGKNLVGSDQYAGTSCVAVDPVGLPTPISTAAKMLFTPDYTTQITTTSDGAVLTVSSIVHQTPQRSAVNTGSIIGICFTVVVVAVMVILLIWYIFYKRRQKRSETHWEIPGGHSDYPKDMPIDRRFARSAGMGAVGAAMGMGGAGRPNGRSMQGSFHSLQSSAAGGAGDGSQMSSPPTPLNAHIPYSDWSPLTPPLDATSRRGHSHFASANNSLHRSGSGSRLFDGDQEVMGAHSGSTGDSATLRNGGGFGRAGSGRRNHMEAHAMAAAYRSALGSDGAGSDSLGTSGGGGTFSNGGDSIGRDGRFEEVQLSDRRSYGGMSGGASGGTFARNNNNNNNVVVHHDAGLLLDDSLSDEEGGHDGSGGIVELPPQYNTIAHRGSDRQGGSSRGGTSRSVPHNTTSIPAFHTTNGSLGSESDAASRSQTNLLGSSADQYRDATDPQQELDARDMYEIDEGHGNDEKEALERRQAARARRAAARDGAASESREGSSSPSPPSAGTTAVVDGGSVFDRARVGLGQPDEEFFWRRT